VIEGALEKVWSDGLDLGDTEGGLHGEGCDSRSTEESMGGEGLEIGGDACSTRWIVAGDGQESAGVRSGAQRKGGQWRQPHEVQTVSYLEANCNQILRISAFDLFDLGNGEGDNISMSDPTMNDVGRLQGKKGRLRTRAGVLAVTLGLTASLVASPTVKRESAVVPGKPPSGKTIAKRHWFQIGKASWYGGKFNGRLTANGEAYDMYAMTCAHRTLPLGSWIRVTNLKNKRSTFLRVNDRGPMEPSRIVDLSYAAAERLGMDMEGLAKVRIEEVNPSDPELAQQMVAQLHLEDPARLQSTDEPPVAGVLVSGLLAAEDR
jgi:rare lipoprotein A